MQRRSFLLLFFLLPLSALACSWGAIERQNNKTYRRPVQATGEYRALNLHQQDFLYLTSILAETYPLPVQEQFPEPGYETLKRQVLEQLEQPVDDRELALILDGFLAKLGNGHTGVALDPVEQEERLYAIDLTWNDKVEVWNLERKLGREWIGAEVTAIQGIPIEEVLQRLEAFVPADNRFSRRQRALYFLMMPWYVKRLGLDSPQGTLEVSVRRAGPEGPVERTLSVPAIAKEHLSFFVRPAGRVPIKTSAEPLYYDIYPERGFAYFRFGTFLDHIAVTDAVDEAAKPFAVPMSRLYLRRAVRQQGLVTLGQLLEDLFAEIEENHIEHLVVDLRGNGGGDGRLGKQFLYFLETDKDLADYRKSVKMSRLFRQHFPNAYRDMLLRYRVEHGKEMPATGLVEASGRSTATGFFREVEDRKSPMYLPPPSKKFDGKLYLLVNSGSFSAAAEFAALIQDNRLGLIVGTPTGGRPSGPTGRVRVSLPNSHLPVSMAHTLVERPDAARRDDEAVFPNVLIRTRPEDFLSGRDASLEWVLARIAEEKGVQVAAH
ncbi:MAG TPA: S41 family peptidase [Thermoanaerobaculia bacterium]|nr:S41 family peptidase [Thermoanaerobaculia bacterium]